ncbi:MAG: type VI secretion system tube protein Hcp [Chloroflexota bacterium]|nr:type VI secretion system tube protein Hcp [Chloroflexota bacterium]
MKLRRQFAFRAVAVLALAGGAVVAAPAVLHDQVQATSSHQTTSSSAPLIVQLPASTDTNGDSNSAVDPSTPSYAISAYTFGVENPTTISSTGGASSGKAKFDNFTITEPVGTYSIQYFKSLASGGHYRQIAINVRKTTGQAPITYLTYLLGDVYITKQEQSDSSGDGGPIETITMSYGSINLSYREQNIDGSFKDPISQCFSQVPNNSTCP